MVRSVELKLETGLCFFCSTLTDTVYYYTTKWWIKVLSLTCFSVFVRKTTLKLQLQGHLTIIENNHRPQLVSDFGNDYTWVHVLGEKFSSDRTCPTFSHHDPRTTKAQQWQHCECSSQEKLLREAKEKNKTTLLLQGSKLPGLQNWTHQLWITPSSNTTRTTDTCFSKWSLKPSQKWTSEVQKKKNPIPNSPFCMNVPAWIMLECWDLLTPLSTCCIHQSHHWTPAKSILNTFTAACQYNLQ